ncbi:MAG: hypothetical protein ACKOS8_19435 [Gemmataceae bacterium]
MGISLARALMVLVAGAPFLAAQAPERSYANQLKPLANPAPLLNDHPDFVAPVREVARYEAPALVMDEGAGLSVRAWRFSYNARGIIEMPNFLKGSATAVIMVHPWGIDDGQGWKTPEPAGVCDFCTPIKNKVASRHTREVVDPFLASMRGTVALTLFSLPGNEDPIRKKMYRSFRGKPTPEERKEGARQLTEKLNTFNYHGKILPSTLKLSTNSPVIDYFRQFPGLDAGAGFNGAGFWDLPVPITSDIRHQPDDVVIYDSEGYPPLRDFLKKNWIRHVLLTGYATDMCYCKTTAGYENLAKDFNLFLVGDASLATFPSNDSPKHATNAALSYAALNHLITQVSWVKKTGTGKTSP